MDERQFMRIKQRLNCIWADLMNTQPAFNAWFDTFRNYDFDLVEKATIKYIAENRFKPTPGDIMMQIQSAKADRSRAYRRFVPQYETLPDGRQVRVIKCKRCRDTGLITWRDNDQCLWGHKCDCEAARTYYGVGEDKDAGNQER